MFPNLEFVNYFEEIKEMYILSLQMEIISFCMWAFSSVFWCVPASRCLDIC